MPRASARRTITRRSDVAKRASVVDEVAGYIQQAKAPARWHERVAAEHVETLAEIKAAWRAGKLGKSKKGAAVGVSKFLQAKGIASIGHNGVLAWLDEA